MSKTLSFDEWWKNEWCKQIHQSLPTYDEVAQSAWNAAQQNGVIARWVLITEKRQDGALYFHETHPFNKPGIYYKGYLLEILNLPPVPEPPKVVDEFQEWINNLQQQPLKYASVFEMSTMKRAFLAGKALGEKGGGK